MVQANWVTSASNTLSPPPPSPLPPKKGEPKKGIQNIVYYN